jgi:signal transduction histidine kinase
MLIWRLIRGGIVAALLTGAGGWTIARVRLGASDDAAVARIKTELRQRFNASAAELGDISARVSSESDAMRAAAHDPGAARHLFDVAGAAVASDQSSRTGITIYDAAGAPLAWAGSVSDLPGPRVKGPAVLFVTSGPVGPRLVRVEPVLDRSRPGVVRVATLAVERLLAIRPPGTDFRDVSFVLSTSIAPVLLRQSSGRSVEGPYTFDIQSPEHELLLEASVTPSDLASVRARWTGRILAAVLSVIAFTLVLCAGPLVDRRRRTRDKRAFVASTGGVVGLLVAARGILWLAAEPVLGGPTTTSPLDLLLTALVVVAVVWLAVDTVLRRRLVRPRPHLLSPGIRPLAAILLLYAIAGAVGAAIVFASQRFLELIASRTTFDLLHFSLRPLSAARLALGFALLLVYASAVWGAATLVLVPGGIIRTGRRLGPRLGAVLGWVIGVSAIADLLRRSPSPPPMLPMLIAVAASGGCAILVGYVRRRARRTSRAVRLSIAFLALLVPSLAMYPSLFALVIAAKERLVATEFGPQAASQREELQLRLRHTLDEIDSMSSLRSALAARPTSSSSSDRAFLVWSETDLARYRLTSAIELYGPHRELISRFALNLPEYTTESIEASSCDWELYDEVSPFGSSERHVLRASRGVCGEGRILGAIVVRVMLDYRTLPFILSQNPYLESLRPEQPSTEGALGGDLEFAVYGWSRAPIYSLGPQVWTLPDDVFQALVASRRSFWASLSRADGGFRVYFLSDRGGIYAIGYPLITWFGHLVNLAELMSLSGMLYVLLLAASVLFNTLTSRSFTGGAALVQEIRTSFYRRLFIAFVAAAVVPVLTLALATRAYFAAEFRAGIEEAAARAATVAQRLVEDYSILPRGTAAPPAIDDQVMVVVGRAIDQDVNLFERSRLQATSERDLFASALLPMRTPGDVYRAIVLDHLPTYVGVDQVGDFRYLMAAAPVRPGGGEGIVTVPSMLRQQEIEKQINELDRRVLFGAVLFCLLGAALGYWMAERIADPVRRLTLATRRLARGDLDAHAAARSVDELGRLINDFNRMATELKRQRVELERTQRLEAWSEMARQVAHDIKNPLTPIQLSAEHALRVNADRGAPLSPVLDSCVRTIVEQVRILRQIAAEFSNFASSPKSQPERTEIAPLLEQAVQPYRGGLAGRIAIEVDAPPDLPAVRVDRTLVSRALANIIENALHAMPDKGRLTLSARVRVADSDTPTPEAIAVEVADTGLGMDAESLARIFEPYFSTKATGTGLGLTIAKRNIELNEGTIAIASERGRGTTVTFTLPVDQGGDRQNET